MSYFNNLLFIIFNLKLFNYKFPLPFQVKISVFNDTTLGEAVQYAHQRFKLESYVDVEDCRLVVYNKKHDCVDSNFESDDLKFCDIAHKLCHVITYVEWLLEIKQPGK